MHIDLNDAIKIHARVSRTRFGRGAKKRALRTAQQLRRSGDQAGAAVWERMAAEIERAEAKDGHQRAKRMPVRRGKG
ncbi:MAG: hypothetical protein JO084_13475 [Bradyrhizobiaceae bacterium]|nr:hypothetical protein [Hyphomicrobiales bacterium]MBV9428728.1 hypothetical protein [Bradyrhizobiaceae bacterium]